jgi:hypothetical protein
MEDRHKKVWRGEKVVRKNIENAKRRARGEENKTQKVTY